MKYKPLKAIYVDYEVRDLIVNSMLIVYLNIVDINGKSFKCSMSNQTLEAPYIECTKVCDYGRINAISIEDCDDNIDEHVTDYLNITGKTVNDIKAISDEYDNIEHLIIYLDDDSTLEFEHEQCDVEFVYLEDFSDDIDDIIDTEILKIIEYVFSDSESDSLVTYYKIETTNGEFNLKWVGHESGPDSCRIYVHNKKQKEFVYKFEDMENDLKKLSNH